ncbi:MAG: o-succinylbenzoate synthase [Actinomycetaceae bacterium]
MPPPTAPEPPGERAVYSTALRTRFRGVDRRDGVLLRGEAGWGEFSPFWDYDDAVSLPWLVAALEAADLGYPEPLRSRVPVNVTVPAVGPEQAGRIVRGSGGCTTAKVKVAEPGQGEAEEIERVAAVRDALGPGGHIRIDANAGWDVDTALARLTALDRAAGGLQYAEQPVATVEELAEVRRRSGVPIAADESVRRAEDPLRVARAGAADVLVLKVQPLGGVRACLRLAEQAGLPVVVSSALESSVGLAAGVALAAALPVAELDGVLLAAGLATGHLLETDVTSDPLLPVDGHLPVRSIVPDAVPAADDAITGRWLARLDAVAALRAHGGRSGGGRAAEIWAAR